MTGRLSDRALALAGWWLFILCAAFFIVSSLRAGDPWAVAGSSAFMAANICFIIPYYRRRPDPPRRGEGG